jgi:hypothetical protein
MQWFEKLGIGHSRRLNRQPFQIIASVRNEDGLKVGPSSQFCHRDRMTAIHSKLPESQFIE